MFKFFTNILKNLQKIIFGYTTPCCIGIDISSTSIKMVELKPNSLEIKKFNIHVIRKNLVVGGTVNNIESIAEIMHNQWNELRPNYDTVAIAIPYSAIVLREIIAPLYEAKYILDEFVRTQLCIDLDNDDIDFDYTLIKKEELNQRLKVVAVKKEKIEEYQSITQMSGMKVAAIDVEPFAIINLFEEVLLKKISIEGYTVLLELGANRLRGYLFFNQKNIIFNELNISYYSLFESLFTKYGGGSLREVNFYEYVWSLLSKKEMEADEIIDAITLDVGKLLQAIRSEMLIEKKVSLGEKMPIFLIGGNSVISGVKESISLTFNSKVTYASELLKEHNPKIVENDMMRLFTAIALASWGQKIEAN